MIKKLYKLKQQQINQQLLLKQQLVSKIDDIDKEFNKTNYSYHHATIDVIGAISDFRVLEIHKETMKEHMIKLLQQKEHLTRQIETFDETIVALNKESEQFNYLLQEQVKQKIKQTNKQEELVASEYMQVQYMTNNKGVNR
jgi:hypothetical protein